MVPSSLSVPFSSLFANSTVVTQVCTNSCNLLLPRLQQLPLTSQNRKTISRVGQ